MDVKFPIVWGTCPYCGSKERFGDLTQPKLHGLKLTMIPLARPMSVSVPHIIIYSDICISCGREYNTYAEKKSIPIQALQGNQPPGGMPPIPPNLMAK